MTVNLKSKLAKLPKARRKKVEDRTAELIADEMTLQNLRKAMKKTQVRVAEELGIQQKKNFST